MSDATRIITCRACATDFAYPGRGRPPQFCSTQCRMAHYAGSPAAVRSWKPRTSCIECGTTSGMAERRLRYPRGSAGARCRDCYNAYCRGRHSPNPTRKRPDYTKYRSCLDCGIDFLAVCSAIRCNPCQVVVDAEGRGAAYALRRLAKKKGDTTITQHLLGERDNWTCHLCGEPVPQFTHCIDGQSATIDHIVPLARGGSHTWDNVRLAHRSCNSARGAKPLEGAWTAGAPKPSSFETS